MISRSDDYAPPGVEVAGSLEAALRLCAAEAEIFIIGGSSVYQAGLFQVVRVEVRVAEGVDELARHKVGDVGNHHCQQRVGGDV